MDMDEDDDIYVPEEPKGELNQAQQPTTVKAPEELEEGEEEDEGGAMDEDDDDSDIDIITERKDGTKAAPPTQAKYSDIRNIPQRSSTNDSPGKPTPAVPVTQPEAAATTSNPLHIAVPSADQSSAAASNSTVDINANPVYAQVGKPITQVNIDEDLPDNEKPWRKPGTDISDYFNYGFDEFTWALYAAKQESVRGEFGADAFAVNNKKMMEDFNMMMMGGGGGGGMGMGGGVGVGNNNGSGGGAAAMTGAEGMPPEMQQMMQQMMASGMDPSQMDMSQMSSMFAGMQNGGVGGATGGAAQGGAGQNFGVGGGYGANQGGGYGGGGGGYNQGGGRGRRGRW